MRHSWGGGLEVCGGEVLGVRNVPKKYGKELVCATKGSFKEGFLQIPL